MPIAPGESIDGYEVLSLLGAGGMGEVYRARDPILRRDVAIKVLPPSVGKDPDRLQRFEQEAQAAAALNHPNILVIYRFGSYRGSPYIASELLEGTTMRDRLQHGRMSVSKAIEASVQIVRGLAAAHEKGIVHRDLKPENLFVTKDGRVKILDFGLAKLMPRLHNDETEVAHGTDPGTVMGTVGYMSPEQVRGAALNHRSDIFAFGAILYEMLTGQRAFRRSTSTETMTAILNEDPPEISRIAPVTPPGLQRVLKRCLEKNPEQRFQSASDLAFALEALSYPSGETTNSSPSLKQATGRSARVAVWIGGAAALLTLGYFVLTGLSKAPSLRITGYSQLTHSGAAGSVVATDGVSIYLSSGITAPIGRMAITGGEIEPFTKLPPRSQLLDVSPDGTTLLYVVYESALTPSKPLYSLKVLGGSPRYLGSVSDAAWSSDGNSIFYPEPNGDMFQMNADGTQAHKLFSLSGPPDEFAVSPDGKTIRYFKDRALWQAAASGEGMHQLIRDWGAKRGKCCGAWSPDGSVFAFLASPKSQIWALDERTTFFHKPSGQPIPLTSSPIEWGSPVFSKDGKQIFSNGSTARGELIRYDGKSKQFLPFLNGISADLLSFSRDGRTVAYSTYPDEVLWVSGVDGAGRTQLTNAPLRAQCANISPDGSQVLYVAQSAESKVSRVYVVSSKGENARLLLPKSSGPETTATWSPDGHRIAFGINSVLDKTALSEIRIFDMDTQQVKALPNSKGKLSPSWSPDGRFILASSVDVGRIYVFDLKTNEWTPVYQGISAFASWSHDSRFIYTFRYADDPAILRVPVKGGKPELVADLKGIRYTGNFELWFGLDSTDAPMLLRDVGTSDVYALSIERK